MEIAIEMLYELHFSVNGKPVGVNIHKTHENGNHKTAVVEILVFFDFFHHNNLSVCRSDHNTFGLFLKLTDRTSVEVKDNSPNSADYGNESPEYR